jgi:glucose-1-phosphate adenylyltransferase
VDVVRDRGRGRILGMVLAGGQGTRLYPLTSDRSKPAVPFGAEYRIIDFCLNNFVNSGIFSIYVLTQFKAQSLTEHIQRYWRFGAFLSDHFIMLAPAQQFRYEELGPVWYRGTADAVYQCMHLIRDRGYKAVVVFGGDHVFKMNVADMIAHHFNTRAEITLAGYPVSIEDAKRFGVLQISPEWSLTGFEEKPEKPTCIPGQPDRALVSMGNYIFDTDALLEILDTDASDENSTHDFGRDVLPKALASGYRIQVYDFAKNPIPGQDGPNTYWRDVGHIDAYFAASMDLIEVVPEFDLFNPEWPLRKATIPDPPAKFVHEAGDRVGRAHNSLVAPGCVVSGGLVRESVLFRGSRINSYATVERSVLFDEVEVGRHCQIRHSIIDKNVTVPPRTRIGYDPAEDRARGFTVTDSGIVVVPKNYRFA